jgi:hypothetical protein
MRYNALIEGIGVQLLEAIEHEIPFTVGGDKKIAAASRSSSITDYIVIRYIRLPTE